MRYKDYLIKDGNLIEKGSGPEDTKGIELRRVESMDKVWISRRKVLTIGVLVVALYLGVTGHFGPPLDMLLSYGSFVLIAATLLSAFTTDRYKIESSNEKIVVPAKGSKGQEFMGKVHQGVPTEVGHEDLAYGGSSDPFVGSAREKQMNLMALGLIVAGSALAIGVAAPMYSDNIAWDDMIPLVEVIQDDESPESQLVSDSSAYAAVYTADEQATGETFESEYARIEISQGQEDLDEATSEPETYVTMDITIQNPRLMRVDVETPVSQLDRLGDEVEPIPVVGDNEEWARYDTSGEFEMTDPVDEMGYERNRNPEYPHVADIAPSALDENPPHIGAEQRVYVRVHYLWDDNVEVDELTDKFLMGVNRDLGDAEINPAEFEEPEPNIVGFDEGDHIRVKGSIAERDEDGNQLEVVLANYTVS